MTREELIKRCQEVWPDEVWTEGYLDEGVSDVEKTKDGNALITWAYVDDGPQYKWHTTHFKKGMKRRPLALAYVCGERNDFND